MSSENFLEFLNSGDGCTILRTYEKLELYILFIYTLIGWIIWYRNCILIKLLKKIKHLPKKRKKKQRI